MQRNTIIAFCIIFVFGVIVGSVAGYVLYGRGAGGNAVNSLPVYDGIRNVEKYARGFEDGIRSREDTEAKFRAENKQLANTINELREINRQIADREYRIENNIGKLESSGDVIGEGLEKLDKILRKKNQ